MFEKIVISKKLSNKRLDQIMTELEIVDSRNKALSLILKGNVFIDENKGIELTFNINAGKRYRIKKISTDIDPVFDKKIFKILEKDFKKFAGSYYSPFKITKILESIDDLIDDNELQFVTHSVSETDCRGKNKHKRQYNHK